MLVSYLLGACYFAFLPVLGNILKNHSTKLTTEDYFGNPADYDISNNSAEPESNSDSFFLEENNLDSRYSVDVLPHIDLPDDSLADSDLKDHNCIDNIMYVYYGGNRTNYKSYGSGIIIIGSVLSCAAQMLTLFCVLVKKYYKGRKISMMLIVAHIFWTMFFSNFMFMMGAYSTRNVENCLLIAILINIFHHHTAMWICLYCLYIYKKFTKTWVSIIFKNMNCYTFVTHMLPPIITLTTHYAIPRSFETKQFCFKSFHRGMILNFLGPICLLLILTTIYAISAMIKIEHLELAKLDNHYQTESMQAFKSEVNSLKDAKMEESISYVDDELNSLKESRHCLKAICVIQLIFTLNWFVTPIALESSYNSTELSYLQAMTSVLLNWYMFFKRKTLLPRMEYTTEDQNSDKLDELSLFSDTEVISIASSDNVPLLNGENGTEMKEFSINMTEECIDDYKNICTISA